MNLKAFFVAALQSALDLQLATADDVLKHVTPDVLSTHLPRPLWARLLTACLGAPRVDAQLVIETIGVPNLCEHVPQQLIWACIADIGARSLGKPVDDTPIVLTPKARPLTPPPPDVVAKPATPLAPLPKAGPSIPAPMGTGTTNLADIVAELEAESSVAAAQEKTAASLTPAPASRVRTPTQQRFRQSQTGSGIGRLAGTASNARRPQAQAMQPIARRGQTEAEDVEAETAVGRGEDWRSAIAVDDEQLVEWQAADETVTTADDEPRKR